VYPESGLEPLISCPLPYQEEKMRVCAILLNYFGFCDTVQCVESLLADDGLEQVVVVDNSSNEDERNKLEHALLHRGRIRILGPSRNLGFAGGVNFGLNAVGTAEFDAFLILNNDTLVPAGTVRCLETRLNDGDFDFVAPAIYNYPDINQMWSNGNNYNRFTGLISQYPYMSIPGDFYYLTGCCLLIRSQVFNKIGFFDEGFFMYGEDVEFCFRAGEHGFKYGLVPEARIFHKGTESSGSNSLFYEYHITRSHLLLCNKLARSSDEKRFSFSLKLFVLSLRAFWRALWYGNANSLRGLCLAFSDFFH
jgi:N-acetylglucosaminyl-diphospho-decaprenol L-rhamnosyltransferase